MKKRTGIVLAFALSVMATGAISNKNLAKQDVCAYTSENTCVCRAIETSKEQEDLQIHAKSAYLMDYESGSVMYAHNEKTHLPIASMCKIMTLILTFDAVKAGVLDLNEQVCVSERASSMGGSQVFLEANAKYPVKELIKSVVVCSANDSCVALAERIAGAENVFVDRMNERAKGLGANDTLFANCTGLPKEPQYSCAKDVAVMLKELLTHEEYYEFGKVWLDKFSHPQGRYTEITNTNKLVRQYEGCDGGKTGFTNQAGFCLAATAKRGDMRVISVAIGADSSKNRFNDVRSMFDYAFANFALQPIVEKGKTLDRTATIKNGKIKEIEIVPARTAYAFAKRGEKTNITLEFTIQSLNAPIKKGEKVGEIVIFKDNVETDRVAVLANENVEKATLFDRFKDVAKGWNIR